MRSEGSWVRNRKANRANGVPSARNAETSSVPGPASSECGVLAVRLCVGSAAHKRDIILRPFRGLHAEDVEHHASGWWV